MTTVMDIYGDKFQRLLNTNARLKALAAWQALRLRPAYAYPSSILARKLGHSQHGCWFVEGSVNGKPVDGIGYGSKSEAYAASGVLAHIAS